MFHVKHIYKEREHLMLLEPKEIEIDGKVFIISKFPAIAGREIITQYPISGLPKIGEYKVNEQIMLKLMSYVAVSINSQPLQLTTQVLIDNHVGSWETLAKLEIAMIEYNVSFLENGRASTFLNDIAQNIAPWITKILTPLTEQLSAAEKPRSKSSKKVTP